MISTFKKTSLKWAIATLALTLVVGCSSLNKQINPISNAQNQNGTSTKSSQNTKIKTPPSSATLPDASKTIIYKNSQYGFNFFLPNSWKGYTIVKSKWEGFAAGGQQAGETVVETGPLISIRHPQWTSRNPRQDIPIMVFTLKQWNSLRGNGFHIGAAPIGPSALASSSKYVFAIPARYNFAFPLGYKEVEQILANKPLQPTTLK